MERTTGYIKQKLAVILSFLAIAVGAVSVNSACMMWYCQPEVPKSMDKFKKLTKSVD